MQKNVRFGAGPRGQKIAAMFSRGGAGSDRYIRLYIDIPPYTYYVRFGGFRWGSHPAMRATLSPAT
jgi:hypothetical protein